MPVDYEQRIDAVQGRHAWWTPAGGEIPRDRRFYE